MFLWGGESSDAEDRCVKGVLTSNSLFFVRADEAISCFTVLTFYFVEEVHLLGLKLRTGWGGDGKRAPARSPAVNPWFDLQLGCHPENEFGQETLWHYDSRQTVGFVTTVSRDV